MRKADLHMHSRVSDGSYTIRELAELAAKNGLDVIAVTDHDTLSHASQIPEGLPVKVIPGIEISAYDYTVDKRVHVLGYGIQDMELVEDFVHPLLEARHENSMKQIGILEENGYHVDLDKIHRADGKYIYKQHIMEYLVQTGQAPDMFGEFYQKIFKNNGICHFDIKYLDPYEAVRVITAAGGKAVLAHSGQQQNFDLIPKLVEAGLKGLELNHPANDEQAHEKIRRYADVYGLFLTGGSDFHGTYEKAAPDLGIYLAEESGVEALC
ncbi:PHP domain-containing protein [Anaerotignum lactatifermentans]|uniref:PHP domain-containing protein n=1 Tax=Anaerotignum lactatifermentans TaxID=160404 RepID=UPI00255C3988|nr:PHP domain-containing protein [Anaerotignum lactatifermentans]